MHEIEKPEEMDEIIERQARFRLESMRDRGCLAGLTAWQVEGLYAELIVLGYGLYILALSNDSAIQQARRDERRRLLRWSDS